MLNKIIKYLFEVSLAIFICFIHISNLLEIDSEALNSEFNNFLSILISIIITLVISDKIFNNKDTKE